MTYLQNGFSVAWRTGKGTPMKDVTIDKIVEVIRASGDIEIEASQWEDSLSDMGMDSISFVQIVVALEEAFACEIPDSKLMISEMDTVQKIFEVLQAIQ